MTRVSVVAPLADAMSVGRLESRRAFGVRVRSGARGNRSACVGVCGRLHESFFQSFDFIFNSFINARFIKTRGETYHDALSIVWIYSLNA